MVDDINTATNETQPILRALTDEAKRAIQGAALIIDRSPFRVGRESRGKAGKNWLANRRLFPSKPNNEFYMNDKQYFRQISREHFLIHRTKANGYEIVDRGSRCGTWINDVVIGPSVGSESCVLNDGDIIVVGNLESPYVFEFAAPPPLDSGPSPGVAPPPAG